MPSIFISYSREDRHLADRLAGALRIARQDVWIDRDRITAGNIWRKEIEIAIKQSQIMVVIMTKAASLETSFVREELRYARTIQKTILPMIPEYIDEDAIPFEIINLHQIRCINDFEKGIDELINMLTPLEQGECQVNGRPETMRSLSLTDRAIISRFRKARRITLKKEITKGNSGSKVFFVDAVFPNKSAAAHFLKIQRAQNDKPRERHNRASKTAIGRYMPRLTDDTPWDEHTKQIAILYSLLNTRRYKSLDELLGKNLAQATTLIKLACQALTEWYQAEERSRMLSAHELLVRSLYDSLDPDSRKRRLEHKVTSVQGRLRELLSVDKSRSLLDFPTRRALPNPLAYLMRKSMWKDEKKKYKSFHFTPCISLMQLVSRGAITQQKRHLAPAPLKWRWKRLMPLRFPYITYPCGHIHGDLNVRNILALFKGSEMSLSLIDFDTYDPDNLIFIDFAYLEIAVILRLCSPDYPQNRLDLELLSEYLAANLELTQEIPDLSVVSVGICAVLRPLRQAVTAICDIHPEYDLAFWVARIAAGLEMSRKTRVTQAERVFSLLVAADSLKRLLDELNLPLPTGLSFSIDWDLIR